jgi:hypothetical protein
VSNGAVELDVRKRSRADLRFDKSNRPIAFLEAFSGSANCSRQPISRAREVVFLFRCAYQSDIQPTQVAHGAWWVLSASG